MRNKKKYLLKGFSLAAIFCLFSLLAYAQNPSSELKKPGRRLFICQDKKMAVKFYCNPDWELQTNTNVMFIVISRKPLVTLTVSKSEDPVIFMEQLTDNVLEEIGQYAEGYEVNHNASIGGQDAIQVKGVSAKLRDMALEDYYTIFDFHLFTIMFTVKPKKDLPQYEDLIKKIVGSFRFLDSSR